MKLNNLALSVAGAALTLALEAHADTVQGFDISNHQDSVDFAAAYNAGARFVMIKVWKYYR
jgi:GH25 family lysozyme M1 (1,4-beta-N-acetylmuramidase)